MRVKASQRVDVEIRCGVFLCRSLTITGGTRPQLALEATRRCHRIAAPIQAGYKTRVARCHLVGMRLIHTNTRAAGNGRGVMLCLLAVLVVGVGLYWALRQGREDRSPKAVAMPVGRDGDAERARRDVPALGWRHRFGWARTNAAVTAEAVVAAQMERFARSRRALAERLAEKKGVVLSPETAAFFDALEGGRWEDAQRIYVGMAERRGMKTRDPQLDAVWPAVLDAYGAAEEAATWPATKLLEYGESVLGSLRPGMAYAGGTDAGRWIPALLNDSGFGDQHVMLTQNALADQTYVDYLRLQYGDRLQLPSEDGVTGAFRQYSEDALHRWKHDRDFPDEPPQIRPGEEVVEKEDGRVSLSGARSVMGINEQIFRKILEANPETPFALEESFPFDGLHASAVPVGGILEVRTGGVETGISPDGARVAADRWATIADELLGDASAASNEAVVVAFSHDAAMQANFLASRGHLQEAERTLNQAMRIHPGSAEVVTILADVLVRQGRRDAAIQMLEGFARNSPGTAGGPQEILKRLRGR